MSQGAESELREMSQGAALACEKCHVPETSDRFAIRGRSTGGKRFHEFCILDMHLPLTENICDF